MLAISSDARTCGARFTDLLEEMTRDHVPLDWARTQNNLGATLFRLGEQANGTVQLEEAVSAYRAGLEEQTRDRAPLDWAAGYGSQGVVLTLIAGRTNDAAIAETALRQIEAAYVTLRFGGQEPLAAYFQAQLTRAQAIRDGLTGQSG